MSFQRNWRRYNLVSWGTCDRVQRATRGLEIGIESHSASAHCISNTTSETDNAEL